MSNLARRYWTFFTVLTATVAMADCRGAERRDFWQAGREYVLEMRVVNRPALTAELQQYFAPLSDTSRVVLRLDSLIRDSVYGTYDANFRHLGVIIGAVGPAAQQFAGRASDDSIDIQLSPNAADAGLWVRGQWHGHSLTGRWATERGSTKGTFVIRAP